MAALRHRRLGWDCQRWSRSGSWEKAFLSKAVGSQLELMRMGCEALMMSELLAKETRRRVSSEIACRMKASERVSEALQEEVLHRHSCRAQPLLLVEEADQAHRSLVEMEPVSESSVSDS